MTRVIREELAQCQIRVEQSLKHLATKVELEIRGGALPSRIISTDQRLLDFIARSEQRLLEELARHTRASQEALSAQISVVDEKYTDLPPRVSRLETTVFTSKQR